MSATTASAAKLVVTSPASTGFGVAAESSAINLRIRGDFMRRFYEVPAAAWFFSRKDLARGAE